MSKSRRKKLPAAFFQTGTGNEPVREWLLGMNKEYRTKIGEDIRTAEFGWPLGMPLCRSLRGKNNKGLWEIRTDLGNRNIARVFFCVVDSKMVLLHGIIKKTEQTPPNDLNTARKRMKEIT